MNGAFQEEIRVALAPGVNVLDVGAGASPTVAPEARPSGCTYVGMDISAHELEKAPPGSYDEIVVAPVETPIVELSERFDLCISYFVLEHVRDLENGLHNIYSYLRPGGRIVMQLAGRHSPFSILNRCMPHSWTTRIVRAVQKREADNVFPAFYDRCSHRALSRLMKQRGWVGWEVRPLFVGAHYLHFSRALSAAYIAYEEWAYRRNRVNLAPYYLLTATRPGFSRSP